LLGRDANLFQALTDQVENLYGAKIALERDIQQQKAILARTIKETEHREAESQFRLLEENKKIVLEQIARQEQLIVDLKEAQDEIAKVREQQSREVIFHEKKMGELEREYQNRSSDYNARSAALDAEFIRREGESQIKLLTVEQAVAEAETQGQIKISQIESKYRILELELQAKLVASEARFAERSAGIRTEIAALAQEHNLKRISQGMDYTSDRSLVNIEKALITEIHNKALLAQDNFHKALDEIINYSLGVLLEIEELFGEVAVTLTAKNIQNEIAALLKEKPLIMQPSLHHKFDMIRLLSCPNLARAKNIMDRVLQNSFDYKLDREITLLLAEHKLTKEECVKVGGPDGRPFRIDQFKLLQRLADDNNVEVDKLEEAFLENGKVNLTKLIEVGITQGEALQNLPFINQIIISSSPKHIQQATLAGLLKYLSTDLLYTVDASMLKSVAQANPRIKYLFVNNFHNCTNIIKFSELQSLDLAGAEVNDHDLKLLSQLSKLERLSLGVFSGVDPYNSLIKFSNLKELITGRIADRLYDRIKMNNIKITSSSTY
jgi:hypothetical protein